MRYSFEPGELEGAFKDAWANITDTAKTSFESVMLGYLRGDIVDKAHNTTIVDVIGSGAMLGLPKDYRTEVEARSKKWYVDLTHIVGK
jgi:hypothetical protein